MMFVSIHSNTMKATAGAGSAYPSEHLCSILWIIVCLFVLFLFDILHIVSPSSIYDFLLPLWYLQTFLIKNVLNK